jgi:hypothetical protein
MSEQGRMMQTKNDPAQEAKVTEVVSSADRGSSSRLPAHNWRAHWLTVNEFSRMMGRSPDTVNWWVRQGILAEFGIPVYRVRHGRLHSGRIFIQNVY